MNGPTNIAPGTRIGGKYEVIEVIGVGGMGVVYKVREQVGAVARIRALKTILPLHAQDPAIVARFRREAEKMCLLEHENIVPVLDYSEAGDFPYLVMPFIKGRTLRDYLKEHLREHGKPPPLSDLVEITTQLVSGLETAHQFVDPETGRPQPIIHRDIKPANIMVQAESRSGERRLHVLLMDFGIAKLLTDDQAAEKSRTDVIGTIRYASPEQLQRILEIDPRTDIYSVGMVLFELYAGRHVFAELSEHQVLLRLMQRQLEEIEPAFPEDTPEPLREVVRRAIAVDRDRRFATIGEIRPFVRSLAEEARRRRAAEITYLQDVVGHSRSKAAERGVDRVVPDAWARAAELHEGARRAVGGGDESEALRLLRLASDAFDRAYALADEEARRDRLRARLSELAALRDAAKAAEADRLAGREFAEALRLTDAIERALSGDPTAATALSLGSMDETVAIERDDVSAISRAIENAERLWRKAEDVARQWVALRKRLADLPALRAEALAREAARHAPAELVEAERQTIAATAAVEEARDAAAAGQALDRAVGAWREAARSAADRKARAEEEAARVRREAEEAKARAEEEAARVRREAEEAKLRAKREAEEAEARAKREADEAAARARREVEERAEKARREALGAREDATRAIRTEPAVRTRSEADAAWERAEQARREGLHEDATRAYQQTVQISREALEVERNQRARGAAEQARAALCAAREELAALGEAGPEEVGGSRGAEQHGAEAERLFTAGQFEAAAARFATATTASLDVTEAIRTRRQRDEHEARLQELRRHAHALVLELQRLRPPRWKDRRRVRHTIALLEKGIRRGEEESAATVLDGARALVAELERTPQAEPRSRLTLPLAIGIAVALALALAVYLAWPERKEPGPTPSPTAAPTVPPRPTLAPTAPPQPTIAPTVPPRPTIAPTVPPRPTVAPTAPPRPTIAPTPRPRPTVAPSAPPRPTIRPTPRPRPTIAPTAPPRPTIAPTPPPRPTLAPTAPPERPEEPEERDDGYQHIPVF